MLGKSISGILGVVERVWGGDGPPRVGLDGFQSIQKAKTCFSIFDFQSCILAFLTFQSFHPNLWCRRRQPASQAGSSFLNNGGGVKRFPRFRTPEIADLGAIFPLKTFKIPPIFRAPSTRF